jgi:hypothetical protein
LIYEIKIRKMDGILLLIDHEKTLNSIKWDFIDKTVKYYKFGEHFRRWVRILYTDIQSCILNNGHMSSRFTIEKRNTSRRPPLALLVFLATGALTSAIKRNTEIRGITIDGTEYLNSLYADDTSLTLENDLNSFNATISS